MANGFGSLYVGASGLQSSQNALNITTNNLANVDTTGYVRQQVVFSDKNYVGLGSTASVSKQVSGLGVGIGDVVHARDVFLDKSYRTQSGRQAFYAASYEANSEVETYLQETDGEAFKDALSDLYTAFSEYAKDPSDSANQELVIQKSELFLSRANGVYDGLKDYQKTINTKISDDVSTINDLGKEITALNKKIQQVEASGVETASDLRDQRDLDLDKLSKLASITYKEEPNTIVEVKLEGQDFVTENSYNQIGLKTDNLTGYVTPYWTNLSDTSKNDYYSVFDTSNVSATRNTDTGEIKALLLARGDSHATYLDMSGLTSDEYDTTLADSVMLNAESEMDTMVHTIVTKINDLLAPNTTYGASGATLPMTATGTDGKTYTLTASTKILDSANCSTGKDGKLPPQELFSRTGATRYTQATTADGKTIYLYNEEDKTDQSTCYTMHSLSVNSELQEDGSKLPYLTQKSTDKDPEVDYTLAKKLSALWTTSDNVLNPSDTTPCTFQDYYSKMVGELGTTGSVYNAASTSLSDTVSSIQSSRQGVFGVSSDEELTNMIRYQNAFNASSRYINVISDMIEYLLSSTAS